ncbi:MAG TPA: hypothetical protein VHX68_06825, partial [Planctomycetaceae bacterium]|nr:hypothetical protein [Planctomycetaceae bacterium]
QPPVVHPLDAAADAFAGACKAERLKKDALNDLITERDGLAAKIVAADEELAKSSDAVVKARQALEHERSNAQMPAESDLG